MQRSCSEKANMFAGSWAPVNNGINYLSTCFIPPTVLLLVIGHFCSYGPHYIGDSDL